MSNTRICPETTLSTGKTLTDADLDAMFYEALQKLRWFINGLGRHGLDWPQYDGLTPEWIVEHYNVEASYFIKQN